MVSDFEFDHGHSAAGYQNVGQRKAVAQPTRLKEPVMNKGVVSFQYSCVGINFENYRIEINSPPLLGFEIKADGNLLKIDVEIVDIFDESTSYDLAYEAVCKLLDHICLMFLVKIGELHKISISLPQEDESDICLIHNIYHKSSIEHVQLQYTPDTTCLDLLKMQIEDRWSNGSVLIRLFRNSMSQKDPVTRYLLLYNVLLLENSDKQKELDNCIVNIDSNVERTLNYKDQLETIYTRLRNEIGHVRQGVESQKTIIEITEHLSKFTDIVKQVVLNS